MGKAKNHLSIDSWQSNIKGKRRSLAGIPENEISPEMCFVAIHYWGAALEYVPEKYKTYELCLDAVRHNTPVDESRSALAYVPDKLKTQELCLEAIRHDDFSSIFYESNWDLDGYAYALNFVPKKFQTPEFWLELMKQGGEWL